MSAQDGYESDLSEICFPKKRRRVVTFSSSEDDDLNELSSRYIRKIRMCADENDTSATDCLDAINNNAFEEWHDPKGNKPKIMPFTSPSGFKIEDINMQSCATVEGCYKVFVMDELFEKIAEQTNLHASQKLAEEDSQRLCKWTLTNKNEMKRFFGLILWMGLVRLPSLHLYWSGDLAYVQTFPKNIMSKNRFELLLRMIRFSNNTEVDVSNRLCKIQPLIDNIEINFKRYYDPPEDVCIDESLIPFRGRIIFREYLKQKRHKYGIKLFKLCCGSGYTYALRVYVGKNLEKESTTPTNVVMSLCKDIFNKGHTLYTDNWYTSLDLANKLLKKNTHLVGTLRSNRRGNPSEMVSKKLKRGEIIAKENEKGITILKWKDKRDILVLSTKHTTEMVDVEKRSQHFLKPKMVVDYNVGKTAVDIADQMIAYNNPLWKSIKWYKKLAFELLLNICVLNAHILFKNVTKRKMSITKFRNKLAVYLLNCRDEEITSSNIIDKPKNSHHLLQQKNGRASKVRKYCKKCYEENAAQFGRDIARNLTRQVTTFCDTCNEKPFLCRQCFNKIH